MSLPAALILVWAFSSQHADSRAYFLNKQSTLTFVPEGVFFKSEPIASPGQGSSRPLKVSPACLVPAQSPHWLLAMAGLGQWQAISCTLALAQGFDFWHLRHWRKKTLLWLSPPAPHCILCPLEATGRRSVPFAGTKTSCTQYPVVLWMLLPSMDQLMPNNWTEQISAAGFGSRGYLSKPLRVTTLRWFFQRNGGRSSHSNAMWFFYCGSREVLLKWPLSVHLMAQDPATHSFSSTDYLSVMLTNQKLTVKTLRLIL